MQKSPPPFVWASPEEKNILNWNFIIRGPLDSPYQGGEYHGLIMFPSEYPFKPPGIKMLTPSGRFQPDKKICFSMSDFHPGTWNPAWSVATICTGILSFMLSDEMTTGSMTSSDNDKRILAQRSHDWNIKQKRFVEAFPDYSGPTMKDLPNMGESDKGSSSTSIPSTPTPSTVPSSTTTPAPTPAPAPVAAPAPATPKLVAKPPEHPAGPPAGGWLDSWARVLWNRWPYAALLALAVMVSRMSG